MPCFDDNIEPIHDTNDEVGMNVDEELVQCIEPIFYTDDEVDTTVNEELVSDDLSTLSMPCRTILSPHSSKDYLHCTGIFIFPPHARLQIQG